MNEKQKISKGSVLLHTVPDVDVDCGLNGNKRSICKIAYLGILDNSIKTVNGKKYKVVHK